MSTPTIEERVATLEAVVKTLTTRLNAQQVATTGVRDGTEGLLQRGKHQGKTHDWVVTHYPDYVIWNAENGYAEGLGFTDQHISDAQDAQRNAPPRR